MNTPFNPGKMKSDFEDYVPAHLRDGKTKYKSEKHDLRDINDREDVVEARKMLHNLIEGKDTAEIAVLIACEVLGIHAVNKESDFTAVAPVNPKHVNGKSDVAFEIKVTMTVDGEA